MDESVDPPPFYRRHVFCCTNVRSGTNARGSCGAKGSERVRNYLKARAKELGLHDVRINAAGCLDRCELGPVLVIYPEGVWYTCPTTEDAEEILQRHLIAGSRAPRLMLGPKDGSEPR